MISTGTINFAAVNQEQNHRSCSKHDSLHRWYQKYGAFYADVLQDALLAERLLEDVKLPQVTSSLILEGGSVHCDGLG